MPSEGRHIEFRISLPGICIVAAIILIPWACVVAFGFSSGAIQWSAPPASRSPGGNFAKSDTPAQNGKTALGRKGNWGRLDVSRIVIEPPEDFIAPNFVAPHPLLWTFKDYTADQLEDLWQRAGLTPAQKKVLNTPANRAVAGNTVQIRPDAELVISLSEQARNTIYAALAAFPENDAQHDPFRCRSEAVSEWFEDFALPADIRRLTERMLYHRSNIVFFSDQDIVLPKIPENADRVRFVKTLSRKSALMVQVHVDHGIDVDKMAQYWTTGRRNKDVKPLLESLAARPNGGDIDVVHLLPPFVRRMLYTYPTPSESAAATARDCHWTSMNFYNDVPDDRFTKIENVRQNLIDNYYQIGGEPMLGDVIMMVQKNGTAVHSCVYIADGLVFTKNGSAFSVPWLLSTLESVLSFYSVTERLETRIYRPKS